MGEWMVVEPGFWRRGCPITFSIGAVVHVWGTAKRGGRLGGGRRSGAYSGVGQVDYMGSFVMSRARPAGPGGTRGFAVLSGGRVRAPWFVSGWHGRWMLLMDGGGPVGVLVARTPTAAVVVRIGGIERLCGHVPGCITDPSRRRRFSGVVPSCGWCRSVGHLRMRG